MRLHWQGSGLLLHELCHLIHQFTLPNGLENATVIEAFDKATKSGLYDRTLRCAGEAHRDGCFLMNSLTSACVL